MSEDSTVQELRKAKEHSDAKRYTAKQAILRRILAEKADEFEVDDPKAKHPGITHKPSGFRMHAPRQVTAVIPREKEADAKPGFLSKILGIPEGGAADIRQEISSGEYQPGYLTGEAKELGEEILKGDWPGVKEEFGDTAYAAQQLFSQATGTNLPMLFSKGPVDKFRQRNAVWRRVFRDVGIPFSTPPCGLGHSMSSQNA